MDDLRLTRPDRDQHLLVPTHWDALLPADHDARMIWAVTGRLDLSAFHDAIVARGTAPGRSPIDPRLLIALWLYATKEGVGSGRALERLCQQHDAYRWLCGGVSISYHTLNDFRVMHGAALDELLTQVLATLVHHDIVTVACIAQDGTRVRAGAGTASFRSRDALERLIVQMRAQVERLKQDLDGPSSATKRVLRNAERKLSRVNEALLAITEQESAKAQQKNKPSRDRAPRSSTTDPQARIMRMADGGYRPAYNVQIATDVTSRAIVGVDVCNHGSDAGQSEPMRRQVERRTGRRVSEQLLDGGYVSLSAIERAESEGVAIYAPLPQVRKPGTSAHSRRPGDGPGVMAWRSRMATPAAKLKYRSRAATVETLHADAKAHRGMRAFAVRGIVKARCVALWFALMHNIMRFAEVWMS